MLEKIRKAIKESYAGIFISFCISFMLLFYEPLNIFASNLDDFWFDIYSFFPIVLIQTILAFVVLSFFFIIIKTVNKKIYSFFVICFFIGLICSYIQGNLLAGSLPPLDGNWIDFNLYKTEKIISIILWIVVSGIVLFALYKFKCSRKWKLSRQS